MRLSCLLENRFSGHGRSFDVRSESTYGGGRLRLSGFGCLSWTACSAQARYHPVTRELTARCDYPGSRRNQASRRAPGNSFFGSYQVTSFQVLSLPLLTLRIPTSTDCRVAYYIPSWASCRLGSEGVECLRVCGKWRLSN